MTGMRDGLAGLELQVLLILLGLSRRHFDARQGPQLAIFPFR
jgi:hypothetical protein